MTTSAAENLAGHPGERKDEKVEKRRALGRGLESLLPGPRVVVSPESRASSPERVEVESSGAGGEKQVPHFVRNDKGLGGRDDGSGESRVSSAERAGAGVESSGAGEEKQVPHFVRNDKGSDEAADAFEAHGGDEVISIQAVAETRIPANLVTNLPLEVIDKNPYQTRYVFDEDMLSELRDSIKEHGVVQPVVVRPAEEQGRYILVLGERRLRASKMAGKETIPALVRRLSPQQAAEMTVLENIVREDLNPIEQAEAFRVLSTAIQADAGADCGPDWSVAGDGVELHAAVAAAAESDGVLAVGPAQLQRCSRDFAAGE